MNTTIWQVSFTNGATTTISGTNLTRNDIVIACEQHPLYKRYTIQNITEV